MYRRNKLFGLNIRHHLAPNPAAPAKYVEDRSLQGSSAMFYAAGSFGLPLVFSLASKIGLAYRHGAVEDLRNDSGQKTLSPRFSIVMS